MLYFAHPVIKHVDIVQRFHHFCHDPVAIVVDMWEIFWSSLPIQTTWIHYLDVMVIMIETCRHVRLIVAMHHGVHHQFSKGFVWVVLHIFLSENAYRHGAIGYYTVTNEVFQFWQHFIQTSFKPPFIQDITTIIDTFETHILYIVAHHEMARVASEHDEGSVGGTIKFQIKQVQGSQLLLKRTVVTGQHFFGNGFREILFDNGICIYVLQRCLPTRPSVKCRQAGRASL